MNMGEKLYKLRKEKNMSQGELADLLEVSRQSVSKWENNTAVPDLQRMVRLSEIFEVSLDYLIKGEAPEEKAQPQTAEIVVKREGVSGRKIAGIILICMAFLVIILFLPAGILYALPFILCAIICLACQKDILLKCIWVVYILADIFFRLTTGTRPWNILYIFKWPENLTSQKIATAVSFAVMLAIIIATVIVLSKRPVEDYEKAKRNAVKFWCLWGGIKTFSMISSYLLGLWLQKAVAENMSAVEYANTFLSIQNTVFELASLILFVAAVSYTARIIKYRK